MKEFIINKNDCGQRTDKFITKSLPSLPKGMMYKLFRKKEFSSSGLSAFVKIRYEIILLPNVSGDF